MKQYIKSIYSGISTVLIGMKITFKHLFTKNVTIQYPNVHPLESASNDKMPLNARNRLDLDYDGCNGCKSCERVCPVNCISIETLKVLPDDPDQPTLKDGGKRKLWLTKYEIDFARCCFCALCVGACPTSAIHTTTEFEYSSFDKNDLIYKFHKLTEEQIAEKRRLVAEADAKAKAEKARLAAQAEQTQS